MGTLLCKSGYFSYNFAALVCPILPTGCFPCMLCHGAFIVFFSEYVELFTFMWLVLCWLYYAPAITCLTIFVNKIYTWNFINILLLIYTLPLIVPILLAYKVSLGACFSFLYPSYCTLLLAAKCDCSGVLQFPLVNLQPTLVHVCGGCPCPSCRGYIV